MLILPFALPSLPLLPLWLAGYTSTPRMEALILLVIDLVLVPY
jgi:hypothetical protein